MNNEYNYDKDIMITESKCPENPEYDDIRLQIINYKKKPKNYMCSCDNLIVFSKYFDIYYCRRCELYYKLIAQRGDKGFLEPCLIQFRDGDTSIKYQWFPSMKNLPIAELTKEEKEFQKWASKMYPKHKPKKKK